MVWGLKQPQVQEGRASSPPVTTCGKAGGQVQGGSLPSLPTPGGNPTPEKKKATARGDKKAGEGRGTVCKAMGGRSALLSWWVALRAWVGLVVSFGTQLRGCGRLLLAVSLLFGLRGGYHHPAAVCLLLQPACSLLLCHVQAEIMIRLKITCFECGIRVASDLPHDLQRKILSFFFSMICVVCLHLSFLSEMILAKGMPEM